MSKYHMKKQDRQISDSGEIAEILQKGRYTVIAMCRDNEPYIVTLSYGYDKAGNALYFHTAKSGLKLDFISRNPEVCAAVIDDKGYIMNECAHEYRSVVLNGRMSIVDKLEEKKHGMEILLKHLEDTPGIMKEKHFMNDNIYENFVILKLDITDITGKKGR